MAVAHLRAYEAVDGIETGALCNPATQSGRRFFGRARQRRQRRTGEARHGECRRLPQPGRTARRRIHRPH